MVNEGLDVARIEARALPLTLTDVAVEPVVVDVLAMVDLRAAAERVTLHTAPPPAPVRVRADERRGNQGFSTLSRRSCGTNPRTGPVLSGGGPPR